MDTNRIARSPRLRLAAGLTVALALACLPALSAAPAGAGGPGVWTNVTGDTGTNLTQMGLVVSADGQLGVAWVRDASAPGRQDLMWRSLQPSGAFAGAATTLQESWATLNDPAVVRDAPAPGLDVLFEGIRSTSPDEVYDGLTLASSGDGGSTWSLYPGGVIDPPGTAGYSSPVSAIVTPSGLFETWYGTYGVWVHRGTSASDPAYDFESFDASPGAIGYFSNLGLDGSSGDLWAVWAALSSEHPGLYASRVDQSTGAPLGETLKLPGSTTKYGGAQEFDMKGSRVPVTGRPGGAGVFVAYPTGYPTTTKVLLWRLTASGITASVIAKGSAAKGQAAVAAGADGRIWVVWSQANGLRPRIYVRRSNPGATSFGAVKYYQVPKGYQSVYHLAAAVRKGKLDVFAHMDGLGKAPSTWHVQFKPPA